MHGKLDATKAQMETWTKSFSKKLGVEPSRIKLEYNTTFQHSVRVTKKDQDLLRRSECSWQALSLQKTGLLFTTTELKKLSLEWECLKKSYEVAHVKVVRKAAQCARTFTRSV